MSKKIVPYNGELKVGDIVVLRRIEGAPIKATVTEIENEGATAKLEREDGYTYNSIIYRDSYDEGYWEISWRKRSVELYKIQSWRDYITRLLD